MSAVGAIIDELASQLTMMLPERLVHRNLRDFNDHAADDLVRYLAFIR